MFEDNVVYSLHFKDGKNSLERLSKDSYLVQGWYQNPVPFPNLMLFHLAWLMIDCFTSYRSIFEEREENFSKGTQLHIESTCGIPLPAHSSLFLIN